MQIIEPNEIAKQIAKAKKFFVSYNISRIRELIRYLSPKKFELFHNIPFLLHINAPNFTGYIDSKIKFYGIYGIFDSGFWRYALKYFNLTEKKTFFFLSNYYYIQGLYLMGSSGTLAQTNYSDFDYWVMIDGQKMSDTQLKFLREKLQKIEKWAKDIYEQNVTFFILDIKQLQENNFASIDEESSGSAQKMLLKEEFYRTFIMIAGKIPYWAVLPNGLDDYEYKNSIELAQKGEYPDFNPKDYIDLGNINDIPQNECFGALLWQVYKSQKDPVKSLIKASLIAYYHFFSNKFLLLCNEIKKRFSDNKLNSSYLIDPYSIVFEKVIQFYKTLNHAEGLELTKICVFLRLSGYPLVFQINEESPKRELLIKYIKEWGWDENKIKDIKSYIKWGEIRHKEFETRILKHISYLNEMFLKNNKKKSDSIFNNISDFDLKILKNKISYFLTEKENKIPFTSAFLRSKAKNIYFIISCQYDGKKYESWKVLDEQGNILFIGPELLHVIGWIFLNNFYNNKEIVFKFESNKYPVTSKKINLFIETIFSFLYDGIYDYQQMYNPASFKNMAVLLNMTQSEDYSKDLDSADFLIKNSWNELFFDSINLVSIENNVSKCYEIAKKIWKYLNQVTSDDFKYQIFRLEATVLEDSNLKIIQNFINEFKDEVNEIKKTTASVELYEPLDFIDDEKPLLDNTI